MIISQISRPGPGQTTTIHAGTSDKIILDFSTQGITLSRDDSALIFTFDGGAAIRLDDFYDSYHADNIPEFESNGQVVSGAEFFSALGPDLMPAAGPAPVERSSHSADYGDSPCRAGWTTWMDWICLVREKQRRTAACSLIPPWLLPRGQILAAILMRQAPMRPSPRHRCSPPGLLCARCCIPLAIPPIL